MSKYYNKRKEAFRYPEQLGIIVDYLYAHGDITCTLAEIEDFYIRFSKEIYGTPWAEVTPHGVLLTDFANWLDDLEVE